MIGVLFWIGLVAMGLFLRYGIMEAFGFTQSLGSVGSFMAKSGYCVTGCAAWGAMTYFIVKWQ